jgi:hypothetical protein
MGRDKTLDALKLFKTVENTISEYERQQQAIGANFERFKAGWLAKERWNLI